MNPRSNPIPQRKNGMKLTALAASMILAISPMAVPQISSSTPGQGRSMVVTKFGIVAAPQFLASQAGAHILEEGGNAIDAAIAANSTMGVVQPYVNGMGGDLFILYYEAKTGKLYGLNSSGWTPSASTPSTPPAPSPVGTPCRSASASCRSARASRPPSPMRRTDFLSPS